MAPADVPPLLRDGIKLIEDRRFDEHHGVDFYGVLRASWANLRAGRVVQGGSTLTQQLVKNYFLSDEQTFGRKATEAVMAMRLEAHYSKEDILVAYLERGLPGAGWRARHPRFRTRQRVLLREAARASSSRRSSRCSSAWSRDPRSTIRASTPIARSRDAISCSRSSPTRI